MTRAKYLLDQQVQFRDSQNQTRTGTIVGAEYFAPNTPMAEEWGQGWHYSIHVPNDFQQSVYHISEADVEGEEQPLQCITCPLGWTPPKYQFLQRVRIKEEDGYYWDAMRGMFGTVVGLCYDRTERFWSYEIEIDPNSPMYSSYASGETEMVWEENLEALEVLCHG